MPNPFYKLQQASKPPLANKWTSRSRFVGLYEMLTFVLVVPSIMVFQVGFVFVVMNIWISSQIAYSRFLLSSMLIVVVNLLALSITYICLFKPETEPTIMNALAGSIILSLSFFGFVALYFQKRLLGQS